VSLALPVLPGRAPPPNQIALLRVIAAPADCLEERWRALQPLDPARIEHGSLALLLLVYERLRTAGSDDFMLPRLKGAYRNVWYRNQIRLRHLRDAIDCAGDGAIIFGDVSRATRFYPNIGLRLIRQIELMTPGQPRRSDAEALVHPGAPPHVAGSSSRQALYEMFAARKEMHRIGAETVAAVEAADELLLACADGVAARPAPALQWLLDIWQILRSGAALDTPRLAADAELLGLRLALRDTVAYLVALDELPDAEPLLAALDRGRATHRDRFAHRLASAPSPRSSAAHIVGSYLRLTRLDSPARAAAGFPHYLARQWNVKPATVPLVAAAKAINRLRPKRRRALL
jgi:hypothetical protein